MLAMGAVEERVRLLEAWKGRSRRSQLGGRVGARVGWRAGGGGGAVAVIDGHDGIGQVLAAEAAHEAITRAKAHGIAAVAVRNSNHFGTAAYFSRLAPAEGCIALLTTNASPAMAPWGAREKRIGNNPWSLAAPAGRHAPMVLDIANTVVARGKVYLARQRGEPIPPGWAIDAAGAPTTDAAAAIAGIILPMGEHKGYAISLMMDVLSGVLSGSGFATDVHGPYQAERRSGCGHLMIALDVARFMPVAEFGARMEQLIATIRRAPLAPGFDRVFYPGEIEAENDRANRQSGITLPDDTIADLTRLARAASLERALPFRPRARRARQHQGRRLRLCRGLCRFAPRRCRDHAARRRRRLSPRPRRGSRRHVRVPPQPRRRLRALRRLAPRAAIRPHLQCRKPPHQSRRERAARHLRASARLLSADAVGPVLLALAQPRRRS